MAGRQKSDLPEEPLWYKDAVIYEVHVKSFFDAECTGMGQLKGLIEKLDYLQDLGVTAIWLLPLYPSPLRDDGYDISDYMDINPDYGTLKDFRKLLREAHKRGLRVITELVLNHTSDRHEWFQRSRRDKEGGKWRNYYVWSQTNRRYEDARIIFKDFETSNWSWDPVANAYYWHRFYHHQPDLNFDNPAVHKALIRVLDFWFGMGVDGMRLDAVPYLYEREGTNCENLPETYGFLEKIRQHMDEKYPDKMLLAEANQWPEDAVAYFGDDNRCHMCFHFPLMPRMFMALQMEDRYPIIDILEQTPPIPEKSQWAVFLRNHDELTLEMVSDEERDYMYRMYARDPKARINLGIRRRLAPLLNNDRRRIELLNVLLFSMPGTPVLYYGDELGMGDNYYLGDRDGVRTPMQWSADRNAGFSRANPQKLYLPVVIDPEYHYEAVNVETQQGNKSSLLWWMKNFIAMRKRYKAFGRGALEFLFPDNPKVLAFTRNVEDERLLVVANLSRYPQSVALDLSDFRGLLPEEVFSRQRFPQIKDVPYTLSLTPHGYLIFNLIMEDAELGLGPVKPPVYYGHGNGRFLDDQAKRDLQDAIPSYLRRRGWLEDWGRTVENSQILEALPMGGKDAPGWLIILELNYSDGRTDVRSMLLSYVFGDAFDSYLTTNAHGIICMVREGETEGGAVDGLVDEGFCSQVFPFFGRDQSIKGRTGEIVIRMGEKEAATDPGEPSLTKVSADANRTIAVAGDRLIFKVFRNPQEGVNPDIEVVRFLNGRTEFEHSPTIVGSLHYRRDSTVRDIAVLHENPRSETDAWSLMVHSLDLYFDRVLAARSTLTQAPPVVSPVDAALEGIPEQMRELISDTDLEFMRQLGKRVGELHLALAADEIDPDFAPEPFSKLYQRSLYQGLQSRVKRSILRIRSHPDVLEGELRDSAQSILDSRDLILKRLQELVSTRLDCLKIRVHGNMVLTNIRHTGRDFFFVNFEGKAHKPMSERRIKRSPLRDIGDLMRSMHHAALTALSQESLIRPEDKQFLEPWADAWRIYGGGIFLQSYLYTVRNSQLVPSDGKKLRLMLEAFLLEKAFLELENEFAKPSGMITLPIRAICSLMELD